MIIQIVPRRLAVPDGIGDHATILARELGKIGINTVFLHGNAASAAALRDDGFRDVRLEQRTTAGFADAVTRLVRETRARAVLVHVSLYGYETRGVPRWLTAGLAAVRARQPTVRVIGFFHELWAVSRAPTTSSFWLQTVQRRIVTTLHAASDCAICTTAAFRDRLAARAASARPIRVMNVYSNVGEPDVVPAFADRDTRLAVFAGTPLGALDATRTRALTQMLRAHGVTEIVDVGARPPGQASDFSGIPIRALGRLAAERIGELLLTCRFGLLPYGNPAVLGKSGVFAAYAAHGVVPLALDSGGADADGLEAGRHYLRPGNDVMAADCQAALSDWYRPHRAAAQAAAVAEMARA